MDCIHGPINPKGMGLESIGMSDEDKKGKQLYIDPTECIDCSACLPECPVDAIVSSEKIAIQMGERQSVIDNYAFFGLKYLLTLISPLLTVYNDPFNQFRKY